MAGEVALINGVSYSWIDLKCVLFGVPLVGITKIDYKSKQKKDNNYGMGSLPVSRGYGIVEYEGSIEIYLEEWKRIIASAPLRDPLRIPPFEIQVVYGSSLTEYTKDVLKYVEFLENPMSGSQGDTSFKITIPLIIGDIKR